LDHDAENKPERKAGFWIIDAIAFSVRNAIRELRNT